MKTDHANSAPRRRFRLAPPTPALSLRKPSVLVVLLLVALAGSVWALDLPKAPAGYSWQECVDIKGALLVPNDWHFLRVEKDERLAYFITPEPWQPPRQLTLGLTFNVLKNVPGGSPSAFGKQYVDEMVATTGSRQSWSNQFDSFVGHGIIYSDGASQFYNLVLANDATGTAYLVVFEAPLEQWQRAWAKIQPVIKRLMIDDEV